MKRPRESGCGGGPGSVLKLVAGPEPLAGLDHVALLPSELDGADLLAIRQAVAPPEARELDHLLD